MKDSAGSTEALVSIISTKLRTRVSAVALASVSVVMLVSVTLHVLARDCDDFPQRRGEIASGWQKGNLIILLRHTERCAESAPGCSPEDPGLTAAGKNQARQIGAGLEGLGPARTDVYYSPTIRTESTARIAFSGDMEPMGFLLDDCAVDLMAKVSRLKREAVNLVLVTHSHCLNELQGGYRQRLLEFNASDDAYYGLALVFDQSARNATDMLSCAVPADWAEAPSRTEA